MKQSPQAGFTLIEVLVTLVIVSILAAYAAPNISAMIEKNRIRTHLNAFASSLLLARSEAALRGFNVTLCASDIHSYTFESTPETTLFCDPLASDFSKGWVVFIDYIGDGQRSPLFVDSNGDGFADTRETVLFVSEPIGNDQDADRLIIEVSGSNANFAKSISYDSLGQVNGNASFDIRKANSDVVLGKISLNSTGRPRTCLDKDCL